jgi:lysyl-tRNA synthetase class 2
MPSSVIRMFHYDAAGQRLDILFTSGRRYSYHEVPEALFQEMARALSKGEFFNTHVRDHFRFTRHAEAS